MIKIEQLLNPVLKIEIINKQLKIVEERNKTNDTLREVIITEIPDNMVAFTTDKEITDFYCKNKEKENCLYIPQKARNQFLNPLSKEDDMLLKKINKTCDAILLQYKNEHEIACFLIEMKSDKPSASDYEAQLLNSKLFVEYLVLLFNQHVLKGQSKKIEIIDTQHILFYLDTNRKFLDKNKEKDKDKPRPLLLQEKIFRNDMITSEKEKIQRIPFEKSIYNYIKWEDILTGNIQYSESK